MKIDEFFHLKLHENETELCKIMNSFGSDKGSGWHNYTTFYDFIFREIKDDVLCVFELGLGTNNFNIPSNMCGLGTPCGSLRGWREYFPKSQIFGADIDKDILIKEDRISTFYCDQTSSDSIKQMFSNMKLHFDVIIEDGLHTFNANRTFFENSISFLKDGGIFVIEDIKNTDFDKFTEYISIHRNEYEFMEMIQIPNPINQIDNNIVLIKK